MWQYNQQRLQHTGVLGMKWGHRKLQNMPNHDVNQKYMRRNTRDNYTIDRINKVGGKQAISDEVTEYDRKLQKRKQNTKIGGIGAISIAALTSMSPLTIATGAAWTTYAVTAKIKNARMLINTNKNIKNIQEKSGIPRIDDTVLNDSIKQGSTWVYNALKRLS